MSKVAEKVADSLYRKDYISEEEKEIYSYGYTHEFQCFFLHQYNCNLLRSIH